MSSRGPGSRLGVAELVGDQVADVGRESGDGHVGEELGRDQIEHPDADRVPALEHGRFDPERCGSRPATAGVGQLDIRDDAAPSDPSGFRQR